jgi:hypothetical protein
MNLVRIAGVALCITVTCAHPANSQGEAAVPFLLISPSAEANGMGGTTIAIRRLDPTSSVFSPSHVGLSALTTHVDFGLCPPSAKVSPAFNLPDLEYGAWSASAGVLLNDLTDLPLRIGIGLAYHHVVLDLGTFVITNSSGPQEMGRFESYENASGFVLGVGIEYLLHLGVGYTFRSVGSHLSPVGTEQEQGTAEVHVDARDYSVLLEAPLVSIVEEITGDKVVIGDGVRPFFGLSVGVGWNNVGDKVIYIDPAQADPFPRTARAGIAVQGGVRLGDAPGWELLSAAWSREAEDLLVVRESDGTWEYQSGIGDIQFATNVVQGDLTKNVSLRSGWQIQVAELFTYRNGAIKVDPSRGPSYNTWGYTVRLAGLLKGVSEIAGSTTPEWIAFLRDHVDVQYHRGVSTQQYNEDHSSTGLTVVYHGLPW